MTELNEARNAIRAAKKALQKAEGKTHRDNEQIKYALGRLASVLPGREA